MNVRSGHESEKVAAKLEPAIARKATTKELAPVKVAAKKAAAEKPQKKAAKAPSRTATEAVVQ